MSIIKLAEVSNSALLWSPEQMIDAAKEEIQSGELRGKKAMLIFLDEGRGSYCITYRNAGFKTTELIAAIEVMKASQLDILRGRCD